MTRIRTPFTAESTAAEVLAGLDLTGRRILITGGTSGLGRAAATALRERGAEVVTPVRGELDLADMDSVEAFSTDELDVIIANAGVMAVPERRLTKIGWESQLAINFLGHFRLISKAALKPEARIVMVSSGAQLRAGVDFDDLHFESRPYDPWVAYSQSKAAEVLLAVALGRHRPGVTANAMTPGRIHTNLQRHLDPATMRAMGAMDDDGNLIHAEGFKTPEQGAAGEVLLAVSPLLEGVTGRYFDEDNQEAAVVPGGPEPSTGVAEWSVDPAAADRLWELAEEAVRTR
ncbi:oxidoreductase [Paractinoplanes abujensis]|uniref:NAD(P)-dependent dehydrogenase (Short-subunit alcohol dehydrogenase family) n=1 Tax=Paractinoplanes abujensis TaxID=882441 RepID=A0A7W7FZL9_9ACTN|nr:SDR family NAD(P)-dependent oxidoreductase [Actinoplanes abujensis]MBB4690667.1 NAD(P)-dependent dehydrogenase (short-subunit alcohol dehydrogenase family) [Actinoplanes abujensis]GID17919.1 oxidoreductase [Actinoplanes abujensis]